jgi:hypothetical protein
MPGEIIIKQECNSLTPPAPPLIIRQQPPRPSTPEPLVIREAPPPPPVQVCRKVITISGKRLPPPPRKVVIERLAPLPSKPQAAIIERWLPYAQVKRRVIFQRSCQPDSVAVAPRNVIVQWEAPQVVVKKEVKYLGVIRANPAEYVQRFGASLKLSKDLPQFVLDIKTPDGLVLAADYQYNTVHELEGDLAAFKLVDLNREGLTEYRPQLQRQGIDYVGAEVAAQLAAQNASLAQLSQASVSNRSGSNSVQYPQAAQTAQSENLASASRYAMTDNINSNNNYSAYNISNYHESEVAGVALNSSRAANSSRRTDLTSRQSNGSSVIAELFAEVDRDSNGSLSFREAHTLFNRLNSRLGRRESESECRSFLRSLDATQDGTVSLRDFRVAYERLLI